MGGKSKISKQIISMIPPHKTYIEPFGGALWVLFGKPQSPVEYVNDIDSELVNLYNVVKCKSDEFVSMMEQIPLSELFYKSWSKEVYLTDQHNILEGGYTSAGPGIPTVPEGEVYLPCSVELACKTYFIIMNSFNGKISGIPFIAVSPGKKLGSSKFYRTDWQMIRNRLSQVGILNNSYLEIIKLLDSKQSFFYFDPPYHCATDNGRYYRYTFSGSEHEQLAVYLSDLRGKFILSYDDSEIVRELYSDYNLVDVEGIPNRSGEVLIFNFELSDKPFYREVGIPSRTMESSGGHWSYPNCPYCGSRNVQQTYLRKTLSNGSKKSRTFEPRGYTCLSCKEVFL